MGGAFDLMVWYLSVIYLLSGFLPAFLFVFILKKLFNKTAFIQAYAKNYILSYPLSALLLFLFQLYTFLDSSHYFKSLANEIPGNTLYLLVFILSLLPLFFLVLKRNKRYNQAIFICSLALLMIIIFEQLYPFIPLDTYILEELLLVIGKSALWFLGFSLLLTLSILFRTRMEKREAQKKSGKDRI